MQCFACPRKCGVDRSLHAGVCGARALPRVARVALHHWEEPCISGTRGSGAVFFSGCNLGCVFCQNIVLHDGTAGVVTDAEALSKHFFALEAMGAHNINLVTPTPHLHTVVSALTAAKANGLMIPVVYNTNAYESVDSLRLLEGLVDIYLPDFKYVSPILSERFSKCADYFPVARDALLEMYRQTGTLRTDAEGIATRGLLIRHLILPGCVDDSRRVLGAIAALLPRETHLSLMRQYAPIPAMTQPPLNRCLTEREYERAVTYCCDLGFTNVWIQSKESADLVFTPEFTK